MKKIILSSIFPALLLVIFLPRFFIKIKIECKSQYGDCPGAVTDETNPLNGKSAFTASRILKNKLKSNFMVSRFSVQFKLPNILRVDLIVKKPSFALKSINEPVFAMVDKEGSVLATASATSLPNAGISGNLPRVGEKIESRHLFALELMEGVYKMYQIGSGNIEGDTLLVDLQGPIKVIFPLVDQNREMLLGSLRLIYSNIQSGEGRALYREIDLRYKNPVLR